MLPACPRHSGQHRAAVPAPATGSAAAPRPAPAGAGTWSARVSAAAAGVLQDYPGGGSEFFTNTDSAYVWAYLYRPPASDVVVVTGKAPTFAPGSHPSLWPARRGRPLLVDVHRRGRGPHADRRQQAPRGRDRLRMPRRRGHQAERSRGLHLRDRQRIAASCHQPRPRCHLPAVLHCPATGLYILVPAEHAGQHVVRALARRASRRPTTRRRPRPSWAPTIRMRRSARWRPSSPRARRPASDERGSGHSRDYFYRR